MARIIPENRKIAPIYQPDEMNEARMDVLGAAAGESLNQEHFDSALELLDVWLMDVNAVEDIESYCYAVFLPIPETNHEKNEIIRFGQALQQFLLEKSVEQWLFRVEYDDVYDMLFINIMYEQIPDKFPLEDDGDGLVFQYIKVAV